MGLVGKRDNKELVIVQYRMHKKAYAKNFSNGKPIKHLLFNHLVQMIVLPSHLTGVFMLISQASQFPADYLYCRHYLSGLSSRYKLHLAAGNLCNSRSIQRIYQLFQRLFRQTCYK